MDWEGRLRALERHVAALERRYNPLSMARSTVVPNDGGNVQTVQGKLDALSTRDAMPVLFQYGFSCSMPVDTDKLVAFIDGDRSKAVVFASNNQTYRIKGLATGEVALYDMRGRFIKLGASQITVQANGAPVEVDGATTVTVNASTKIRFVTPRLEVTGDIIDHCDTQPHTMADERSIYNTHTHDQTPDSHGDAEQPTEVPNQLM
jgi:phage gp45-like